jgi:hypothetical protein
MPYANLANFGRDQHFSAVVDLFTVELVVRSVEWKHRWDAWAVPVDRADAQVGRDSMAVRQPLTPT